MPVRRVAQALRFSLISVAWPGGAAVAVAEGGPGGVGRGRAPCCRCVWGASPVGPWRPGVWLALGGAGGSPAAFLAAAASRTACAAPHKGAVLEGALSLAALQVGSLGAAVGGRFWMLRSR